MGGEVAGATIGAGWGGTAYTFSFTTLMTLSSLLPLIMTVVAFDIPDISLESKRSAKSLRRVTEYTSKYRCSVIRTTMRALWACRFVLGAAVLVAIVPEFNTSLFFYMLGGGMEPRALSHGRGGRKHGLSRALFIYNATRPGHQLSFGFGILLGTLAALVGTFMANDSVPWLLEAAAVEAVIASTASILCLMPTITVIGVYVEDKRGEHSVLDGTVHHEFERGIVGGDCLSKHGVVSHQQARRQLSPSVCWSCLVLSSMTLPSAMCFPSRSSASSKSTEPTTLGHEHPGIKRQKKKKKNKPRSPKQVLLWKRPIRMKRERTRRERRCWNQKR